MADSSIWSSFDKAPSGIWDAFDKKQPTAAVTDYAKAVGAGITGLAEAAGKGITYIGRDAGQVDLGKPIQEAGAKGSEAWIGWMTPAGQRALNNEIITDDLKFGETPWQSIGLQAAMSLPSMVATIPVGVGGAGLLTRAGSTVLAGLAERPGMVGWLASNAPTAVSYGASEGVIAALQNAAQTEREILSTPIQKLQLHPNFNRLFEETDRALPLEKRFDLAREATARLASDEVAYRTFASTGGIGILTGGGALGGAHRAITAGVKGGVLKATRKGALEEFVQEAPQSGDEEYIQNLAKQKYVDQTIDPTKGVVSAAASGGVVGAATGAAFGAGGRVLGRDQEGQQSAPVSPEPKIEDVINAPTVGDAVKAAADMVEAPLKQAGAPVDIPEPVPPPRARSRAAEQANIQTELDTQKEADLARLALDSKEPAALFDAAQADRMREQTGQAAVEEAPSAMALALQRAGVTPGRFSRPEPLSTPESPSQKLPDTPEQAQAMSDEHLEAARDLSRSPERKALIEDEIQRRRDVAAGERNARLAAERQAVESGSTLPETQDVMVGGRRIVAIKTNDLRRMLKAASPAIAPMIERELARRVPAARPAATAALPVPEQPSAEIPVAPAQSAPALPVAPEAPPSAVAPPEPVQAAVAPLEGEVIPANAEYDPSLPFNPNDPRTHQAPPRDEDVDGAGVTIESQPVTSKLVEPPKAAQKIGGKPVAAMTPKQLKTFAERGGAKIKVIAQAEIDRRDEESGARAMREALADENIRKFVADSKRDFRWDERGGRMIVDETTRDREPGVGTVLGRSEWLGPELWKNRPDSARLTPEQADAAVDKALAGKPLGEREQRFVNYLVDRAREFEAEMTDLEAEGVRPTPEALLDYDLAERVRAIDPEALYNIADEHGQNHETFNKALRAFIELRSEDRPSSEARSGAQAAAEAERQVDAEVLRPADSASARNQDAAVSGGVPSSELKLEGETASEIARREAEQKAALEKENRQAGAVEGARKRAENRAEQERRAEEVRKERADAAVENFELGQAAPASEVSHDQAAGQQDLLAASPSSQSTSRDVAGEAASTPTNKYQPQPVAPGRKIKTGKGGTYRGEFHDAEGNYLGDLHQTGDNEFRVITVRSGGTGQIEAESAPLTKADIVRTGSSPVSASRSVNIYKPAPTQTETAPAPTREQKIADALRGAADAIEEAVAPERIDDFGEKIGGARKDVARPLGKRTETAAEESAEPGWRKRFSVSQIAASRDESEVGQWVIRDERSKDWRGQPRQVGQTFATKEAAERAVPLAAVALKHHVVPSGRGETYAIWRYVTDRKRVQVVKEEFATRDAAMLYMAENAVEIIETKTGFGEEILAKPDRVKRIGAARRTGPATAQMFTDSFGFRAVEFGLWNNQEERQEVMNHAYDGLLDLAEVLNVPPMALSLNGDLALAFGARGQGLSGAKAHYEMDYGVINLTKMTGAGSLAHEWFHALDHYFARMDTKAKSEKVKNERGDMVYPDASAKMGFASHGFRVTGSKVRPELQKAYTDLIQTMFTKAEQYVEDTQKAEKFVGSARERLAQSLKEIRDGLLRGPEQLRHMKRNNKPASAEQLATFDQLVDKLVSGQDLATTYVPSPASVGKRVGSPGWMAGRQTNDTLEGISAILKAVRGRNGFTSKNEGALDGVRYLMKAYSERIKILESANANETKTKRVPTSYAMENKKIDQGRASDYWTTEHEMAARAFSAYVEDKVAEQGNRSDFLAYGAQNKFYALLGIRPFPEGTERKAINAAFDKFIAEIETKDTETGVAMYQPRQAYNPNQLDLVYENAEVRPGTTDEQRATGIAALRALFGRDRRAGATLLGSALWRDFTEGKGADLIGRRVKGHEDLATVAQVLRDPRFETLRVFFVKDNVIVGHSGITSRLPGTVAFAATKMRRSDVQTQADLDRFNAEAEAAMTARFADLAAMKERLGADGYWMLHNHPSGKSRPSMQDMNMTGRFSENLPGFRGHIVIDHDEYSHIHAGPAARWFEMTGDGMGAETHRITSLQSRAPELPHDALGHGIMAPSALVNVAKTLQAKTGYAVAVSTDSQGNVSAIAEIPQALLEGKSDGAKLKAMARIRRFGRMTSSPNRVFLISENKEPLHFLIKHGIVQDIADFNGIADRGTKVNPERERNPKPGTMSAEQGAAAYSRTQATAWEDAPYDESAYVPRSEVYRLESSPYVENGVVKQSSRQNPNDMTFPPLGTWTIDDTGGLYGREIEQLVEIPIEKLMLNELDSEGKLDPVKRGDDERYAEWLKEGRRAPPVNVVQTDGGKLSVTDGHRRVLAAKRAGRTTVEAWVNYAVPIPDGSRYSGNPDGKFIRTGLTFEMLSGEVDNPYVNERMAFRRGPSSGTPVSDVRQQAEALVGGWALKPKLVITETSEEWGIGAPSDAKGAHWRGTMYLASSAHASDLEARETSLHEGWHYAVWKMGKAIEPELNRIWSINPGIRREAAKWMRENTDVIKAQKMNPVQAKFRSIDEAMAVLSQKNEKIGGLKPLLSAIQKWLRAHGMENIADWLEQKTDAEALALIAEARRFVERGEESPHVFQGAAPAMARNTDAVTALNNKMASDFKDDKWRNAYALAEPGTSRNRVAAAVRAAFGAEVVALRPTQPEFAAFAGMSYGGRIYINVDNGRYGFAQLIGHELLHKIRKEQPTIYEWFAQQAENYARAGADERYGSRPEMAGATGFDAREEILADFTGDAFADPDFLKALAKHNPGKFKQLLNAVVTWLKKVVGNLSEAGFGSSEYFDDVNGLRGYLIGVLDAYQSDPNAIDEVPRYVRSKEKRILRGDEAREQSVAEAMGAAEPNARGDRGVKAQEERASRLSARGIHEDPDVTPPGAQLSRSRASWDTPEQSKLDDLIYTLQDKHVDTKRVMEAIRKTGKELADEVNVYLQEELFHGRAAKRVQDFVNEELKPLMTEMAMRGFTMQELEKYLHARHAEERNAQVAKVNPDMPDGGSGMTDQAALDYLGALDPQKKRMLEALAVKVDAINEQTRQTIVDYGLESADTIAAWQSAYKHYVPLYRDDDAPGIGQGYSVKGPASKRAMGSKKDVVDIIANIAMQRERAIVRGEKNRVANALVGLAQQNPNEDFWSVDNPPTIRYIDPRTGLVSEAIDPLYKSRENVIMARSPDADGNIVEHAVVFNEDNERAARMAQALKNLDIDDLGAILGASAKVTRYFASVNTQYNPIFGVVNITRDTQGALINLSSTPLAGKQKEVLQNTLSALRGIYIDLRDQRAGKEATSAWAQEFEEFQEQGGQTAYRDLFRTSKDRAEAIEREIKRVSEGKARQFGRAVFDWLSDYNAAMENAVRLAAYKVAKDSGLSLQQAASLAKNLTVNFNRKGQITTQMSALYAFVNASIQGTARLAETLAGPAGKKIIIGGITLGVVQALALAAAGFDDNEPPDFVRQRNLVIPVGDGKYITIPMPLGLHFLPNLGRIPVEFALSGFRNPGKRIGELFSVFVDAFNPVGSGGSVLQAISPTIADPLAALAENKDWTGKPIARQDFGTRVTPGHTRAKDTATAFSKSVSKALNWMSGGTDYKPGIFSPTPDQIDYLVGQVTGGIGREIGKVEQTIASAVTGEDLPSHKIPLFGRFYGTTDESSAEANRFYTTLREMKEHEAEIKGRRKAGEPIAEYLAANPEARLYQFADKAERDVSKLRKMKRELMEKDAPRDQIKALEDRITGAMKRLNSAVRMAREREAA